MKSKLLLLVSFIASFLTFTSSNVIATNTEYSYSQLGVIPSSSPRTLFSSCDDTFNGYPGITYCYKYTIKTNSIHSSGKPELYFSSNSSQSILFEIEYRYNNNDSYIKNSSPSLINNAKWCLFHNLGNNKYTPVNPCYFFTLQISANYLNGKKYSGLLTVPYAISNDKAVGALLFSPNSNFPLDRNYYEYTDLIYYSVDSSLTQKICFTPTMRPSPDYSDIKYWFPSTPEQVSHITQTYSYVDKNYWKSLSHNQKIDYSVNRFLYTKINSSETCSSLNSIPPPTTTLAPTTTIVPPTTTTTTTTTTVPKVVTPYYFPAPKATPKPKTKKVKVKQTTFYRTGAICADGWPSSATGSGACSHHGGVYKWLGRNKTTWVTKTIPIIPKIPKSSNNCLYCTSPINALPKTNYVNGYYRSDGTYVNGYYRSK